MDEFIVRLAKSAEKDLDEIVWYISAQLGAPVAAKTTLQAIKKSIGKLKTTALVYSLVRSERLAAVGYRQITVKNYSVFYTVNVKEKIVFIERILYGSRDWTNIL